MQKGNNAQGDYVELLWEDLTETAQKLLLDFLGDNGNFDVFPIATIYRGGDY